MCFTFELLQKESILKQHSQNQEQITQAVEVFGEDAFSEDGPGKLVLFAFTLIFGVCERDRVCAHLFFM